ncbi:MAG: hypothetical protein EXS55_02550 [Candidatus Magasanikbacteria bacterium]|nr:hypothetical protein [Candidatus Magasanikbacteria bacterium]
MTILMTYQDAYIYLIALGHIKRKEYLADHRACGWYLRRMQFLLNMLGNPERRIPHYIHVTGTSGKGSVCIMLASILRASGKKVGLLTSPHPSVLMERWEVNGKMMSEKEFTLLIEKLKPVLDKYLATTPYDMVSFSELMTAIALYYFAQQGVKWAVWEVACGGRYDATNIIPWKDVAVITNVGLDHVGILGDTKEKIAYEKAGIIKRGCQVFTAERDPKILKIIQRECKKTKTLLTVISTSIHRILSSRPREGSLAHQRSTDRDSSSARASLGMTSVLNGGLNGINFIYKNTLYHLPTLGAHQIKNAVLAIEIVRSLNIPTKQIQAGLAKIVMPIRMEVISRRPLIILDGAHNVDKMKTTVETMKTLKHKNIKTKRNNNSTIQQFNNLHLVIALAADKNAAVITRQLASLKPKSIACTHFTCNPFRRAADPAQLAKRFKKLLPKSQVKLFLDPRDALAWSRSKQKKSDVLLVTGSIFLSGELRNIFL